MIDRPCALRLSRTVNIRSAKREPRRPADPKEFSRHGAALGTPRSLAVRSRDALGAVAAYYDAVGSGGISGRRRRGRRRTH